jgi:Arc/MetJ-type ribon-helix-helix transcriptional regulator
MISINLTEDLERFVLGAVRTGRYASEDDVVRDALTRLRLMMPEVAEASGQGPEPGQEGKPLTKQEFHRHLVKIGLMDQAPSAKATSGDPDESLIDNAGEVISEVVIRERLIEWLIGFL